MHVFDMISESLDELTELVVKLMSSVENKNVTIPTYPIHPYGEDQVKVMKNDTCYIQFM